MNVMYNVISMCICTLTYQQNKMMVIIVHIYMYYINERIDKKK